MATEQRIEGRGDGNLYIQIVGDGNSVVAGLPRLALTPASVRIECARTIHTELDLLSPYARTTELLGRAAAFHDRPAPALPAPGAVAALRPRGRMPSSRTSPGR